MKGDLMMTSRQNGERTRVMVVEQDLDFGLKLADWLATHGYHPAFISTANAAIDGLADFRPQAVFVGLDCSARAARVDMVEVLLLIQSICPSVPVIMMSDQSSEDLTQVVLRQGIRRLLVKPVEFSYIGEVLESELSAKAA
jgi:DNA-binding NtrC family response regulator